MKKCQTAVFPPFRVSNEYYGEDVAAALPAISNSANAAAGGAGANGGCYVFEIRHNNSFYNQEDAVYYNREEEHQDYYNNGNPANADKE